MSAAIEEEEIQSKETDEEILQRAYEAKLGSLFAKAAKVPIQYEEIVQDVDAIISAEDAGGGATVSVVEQSLQARHSSKQPKVTVTKDFDYADWSSRSIL